jgi:uncharacterized protein
MNSVVHFEVPFDDEKRATEFYKKVFGWEIQLMPEMKYVIARTAPTDENQMLKEPGAINGGMYKREKKSAQGPVLVMAVDSVKDHLKKVEKAGGKVFMPEIKVGDMGMYAQVKDTEGNVIGIWQTIKK